ncbi:hypothetical protein QQS21_008685 [Conoideocrella luteorostrata]|uniref:SnoaL-like domain-containing protein n=1 Tax=Conoideocrella luteorostrata TaxID=1105319 RepID=A0AAJ0CJ88_9HYPO|nr:hypothetical protein QQS21_008685 [Conoideocrella luteorostrata]
MATQEAIQALAKARQELLRAASESRDVDALMASMSKDIIFTNKFAGVTVQGWDAVRDFYAQAYESIPQFSISNVTTTSFAPEFVAGEMDCAGVLAKAMPQMNLKEGDMLKLRGVSLYWWRWEGKAGGWDGSLSDEAVRSWKIYKETAFLMPIVE